MIRTKFTFCFSVILIISFFNRLFVLIKCCNKIAYMQTQFCIKTCWLLNINSDQFFNCKTKTFEQFHLRQFERISKVFRKKACKDAKIDNFVTFACRDWLCKLCFKHFWQRRWLLNQLNLVNLKLNFCINILFLHTHKEYQTLKRFVQPIIKGTNAHVTADLNVTINGQVSRSILEIN